MTSESKCFRKCCVSTAVRLDATKSDFNPREVIATGATSKVVRGHYQGRPVAVKQPSLARSEDLNMFHKELQLYLRVNHPHVVGMLGARAHPPDYSIILPLCKCNLAQKVHEQGWRPNWATLLQCGAEMAAGVAHLHELQIVHRDLKPANVLMDDHGVSKVTDLGLCEDNLVLDDSVNKETGSIKFVAKGRPTGGFHKVILCGTLEYMAPEVLQKKPQSYASDVFALAVTLNEICTATVPYSDCTVERPGCHTVLEMGYGRLQLAAAVAGEGLRPIPRDDTPAGLLDLLHSCWDLDPTKRPGAQAVQDTLLSLRAELSTAGTDGTAALSGAATDPTQMVSKPAPINVALLSQAIGPTPRWGPPSRAGAAVDVRMGAFGAAGRRGEDRMEDRHIVMPKLNGMADVHLAAVFDGHRGAQAAEYMKQNLVGHLGAAWRRADSAGAALSEAFLAADAAFVGEEEAERQAAAAAGNKLGSDRPGCTALAALLWGSELVVANAGDCRAILSSAGRPVVLTRDHSAEDPAERERIAAAGGVLEEYDTWRVGAACLQITRSIGDADAKVRGSSSGTEDSSGGVARPFEALRIHLAAWHGPLRRRGFIWRRGTAL
ncbi:hypothetical protein CYMTET_35575 [Cymbomonas tetramitiformis]|uniref:Protein-serine/threonine phosphatase n=1 Tax=Cymbomonas tetramitiformis TaxID=36881 RepID=A0AAE0F8X3_9CHLO|nr:hypothetical protein CYMTET_35575 [Cymbomonas tetramitiformis]